MNILVTGGAGFIGSNLVARLLKEGHKVEVIDNLHTGSEQNLQGLDAKFFKGNCGDIAKLGITKPQVIFHEGIYSSSPMYKKEPHLTAKVIDEFISILEYAKINKCKVIFASTSSLYCGQTPPQKEGIIPIIADYYTEARIMMERIAKLYSDVHGVSIIGLRYFSVYGPNEKSKGIYANLISQFLWDMQKGVAPVLYGDGSQTRDFTFVDDVVEANILAMNKQIPYGIYNVGTGRNYTLLQLVEILNKALNTQIKPTFVENKIKNYVQTTLADTTLAKNELGFEAKVSLEEGINKLIEAQKS